MPTCSQPPPEAGAGPPARQPAGAARPGTSRCRNKSGEPTRSPPPRGPAASRPPPQAQPPGQPAGPGAPWPWQHPGCAPGAAGPFLCSLPPPSPAPEPPWHSLFAASCRGPRAPLPGAPEPRFPPSGLPADLQPSARRAAQKDAESSAPPCSCCYPRRRARPWGWRLLCGIHTPGRWPCINLQTPGGPAAELEGNPVSVTLWRGEINPVQPAPPAQAFLPSCNQLYPAPPSREISLLSSSLRSPSLGGCRMRLFLLPASG